MFAESQRQSNPLAEPALPPDRDGPLAVDGRLAPDGPLGRVGALARDGALAADGALPPLTVLALATSMPAKVGAT